MKLTKQERAAVVLLVCVFGLGIVAAVIAAGWVMTRVPVVKALGCWAALVFLAVQTERHLARWWSRKWIKTTFVCRRCGLNTTSEERYLEHTCVVRRERKGEGEL